MSRLPEDSQLSQEELDRILRTVDGNPLYIRTELTSLDHISEIEARSVAGTIREDIHEWLSYEYQRAVKEDPRASIRPVSQAWNEQDIMISCFHAHWDEDDSDRDWVQFKVAIKASEGIEGESLKNFQDLITQRVYQKFDSEVEPDTKVTTVPAIHTKPFSEFEVKIRPDSVEQWF